MYTTTYFELPTGWSWDGPAEVEGKLRVRRVRNGEETAWVVLTGFGTHTRLMSEGEARGVARWGKL